MAFKATMRASKEFKTCLSAIQTILEEATFVVTSKGINFKGVEPSNVSFISVDFPKDKFIDFLCDTDTKFTVRTNEFLEIMKRAKSDEEFTLEMNDKVRALQIYIGGKKHYVVPLLVMEKDTPTPNFKLQSKISLKLADFVDYVKDIKVVADNIIVETNGMRLKLSGKGSAGNADVDVEGVVSQSEDGDLKGEYSLEYLFNTLKNIGAGFDDVLVEHGHNLPLQLTFASENTGTLVYVQAPKVV